MESSLVYLEPDKLSEEPFTTSKVIAEMTGVKHRSVVRLIQKHEKDFSDLGKVRFQIAPLAESKTGQNQKIYHLTEQQATYLFTMLKNTPVVVAFKKELVRQFYVMRRELLRRNMAREERKPIRRSICITRASCGARWRPATSNLPPSPGG